MREELTKIGLIEIVSKRTVNDGNGDKGQPNKEEPNKKLFVHKK